MEVVSGVDTLLTVRRSAIKARVAAIRQLKSSLVTAPEALRSRWSRLGEHALIDGLASTRPGTATDSVLTATAHALPVLARRYQYVTQEIVEFDDDSVSSSITSLRR
ncbi:hypothetical protein [Rhodococcus rhodochrous]|uniref:hypothetical protein n=1 Tax=Rhodococcus rhodochrous TaxID=1829 RepID=UPI0002F53C08|nr:hypothetical protein [Rhodococcus rhodochrous]